MLSLKIILDANVKQNVNHIDLLAYWYLEFEYQNAMEV